MVPVWSNIHSLWDKVLCLVEKLHWPRQQQRTDKNNNVVASPVVFGCHYQQSGSVILFMGIEKFVRKDGISRWPHWLIQHGLAYPQSWLQFELFCHVLALYHTFFLPATSLNKTAAFIYIYGMSWSGYIITLCSFTPSCNHTYLQYARTFCLLWPPQCNKTRLFEERRLYGSHFAWESHLPNLCSAVLLLPHFFELLNVSANSITVALLSGVGCFA